MAASVPSTIGRRDLPVPKSPIRQSGSPFLPRSQAARVWTTAASMSGLASKSKALIDFSHGNCAASMRRSERRARSSH